MKPILFMLGLALLLSMIACSGSKTSAKKMTQQRLHALISQHGTDVDVKGNVAEFTFGESRLYCVSDSEADRMRIVVPIANVSELEGEEIMTALAANFHTVLDARYAIGGETLYAAFIHPLSPITERELLSAIRQVATAAETFGDEYTSGELVFPGGARE